MAGRFRLRALYAFSFLKNLQFFGALAVPFYLYRLSFDYSRMFILEAIFSVAMMLLEIPTGIVADKWGRKISLLFGALFLGASFFAFGVFRDFWVLALAELVCAVGMKFWPPRRRLAPWRALKTGYPRFLLGTRPRVPRGSFFPFPLVRSSRGVV